VNIMSSAAGDAVLRIKIAAAAEPAAGPARPPARAAVATRPLQAAW
jgi:hypothetical protein